MKAKSRPPIVVIAAAALLCLVLVSMSMTSGVFARYTAKAENPEEDSAAQVAAFAVSVEEPTESQNPVTIIADGTDDNGKAVYTVKVKNDSEVAVQYEAVVNFTGEKATENAEKFDNTDDQLTFTGYLAPTEAKEETLTLDMSAYFEENDKYNTYSNDDISGDKGKAPFEVNVKFTQVD